MTTTPVDMLAEQVRSATPDTISSVELRDIRCRAKRLGRLDLLPRWMLYSSDRPHAPNSPTPPHVKIQRLSSPEVHDPEPILLTKARDANIPVSALRSVYCREIASTAPLPPHLTRTAAAHARVNSFIRLAQGDPTARSDDADLLPLLGC